jgi:hypothetical protein
VTRANRLNQLDYSHWNGSLKEHLRERLIINDLEREMTVAALNRVLEARSKEDMEVVERCNSIELPWMFGNEQDIIEDLDKFLQEHEND